MSIDGQKPDKCKAANDATSSAVVRQINYARHGETPDGMARIALNVGDSNRRIAPTIHRRRMCDRRLENQQ